MEKVGLYHALYWDCPNCKERNFEIGIPTELSNEEYQEAKEAVGDIGRNEFFMAPMDVVCKKCDKEYKSESPDGDEGSDITGLDDIEDLLT